MGCKACLGRYGLLVAAVLFTCGVISSTVSPSWVSTTIDDGRQKSEIEFGPFYSRTRTCTYLTVDMSEQDCTDWETDEISGDCDSDFVTSGSNSTAEVQAKLCRQQNTWRILAMLCLFIVVGTGIMVLLASFTQCLTCGCCGGSFDTIASIAYWIEVALSIVSWSFCISVVTIINDSSFTDLVQEEASNIVQLEDVTGLVEGNFLWGFWIFIASGTVLGAVCATLADWAGEGSILQCLFCCNKN